MFDKESKLHLWQKTHVLDSQLSPCPTLETPVDGGLLTVSSVCQDVDSLFFTGTPPFGRCFPGIWPCVFWTLMMVTTVIWIWYSSCWHRKTLRLGIRYFSLSDATVLPDVQRELAMYTLRKQIVLAERNGLFRAASAATITKHFLSVMLSCFKKPSDAPGCLIGN